MLNRVAAVLTLAFVLFSAVFAFAVISNRGSVTAEAAATNFERNFTRYTNDDLNVHNLTFFPHSADIKVVLYPNDGDAVNDTLTFRAGSGWPPLYNLKRVDGFLVIRPVATIVDVHWWP